MEMITIVGSIAACCTTLSFVPQAIQTIKTKDTSAISGTMYTLFTVGTLFWLTFGVLCHSIPVLIANAVTLVLASVILHYKLRYK